VVSGKRGKKGGNGKTLSKYLLLCTSFLLFLHIPGSGKEIDPCVLESRAKEIEELRDEKDRFFKESSRSPLRAQDILHFKELDYYPFDPRYVFMGEIERNPKARTEYIKLPTNKGNFRKYVKHGKFRFSLCGREFILTIYRHLGRPNLFLPFRDKTNGLETYENGRYIEVDVIGKNRVLIDFNKAANPFCAYNDKYTCPYANEENTLDIPIKSGEKKFK
jgi:uncharacterized protein (DUF1684 family)